MLITGAAYGMFLALLVVAAVIDLRELRIPNALVLALVAVWVLWQAARFDVVPGPLGVLPASAVRLAPDIGEGLMGALLLGGVPLVTAVLLEAASHQRAVGGGDIKLLAAVGLYLGPGRGVVCVLASCVAALVLAVVLPRMGWRAPPDARPGAPACDVLGPSPRTETPPRALRAIPFGPAIALGALVGLLLPPAL